MCPTAFINIISNPVNSLVPMAKEILTAAGVYNPKKLCGVTTLDIVRANTFVSGKPSHPSLPKKMPSSTLTSPCHSECCAFPLLFPEMKGTTTTETYVPVIGGHSGLTILPLLSQTTPAVTFTDEEVQALSDRIRDVSHFPKQQSHDLDTLLPCRPSFRG